MSGPVQFSVGRVRVTGSAKISERGYIRSIRKQMDAIIGNVKKAIKHIKEVTPEALVFGIQPVFDLSQELVPIDTGDLKASGFIETRETSSGAQVFVGYGRHGRPFYAGFVHERLDVRHAAGKQAKFLQAAVDQRIDDFSRRVALYMKRNAGLS